MENFFEMNMSKQEIDAISNLGLAHMGDCVFEILVRAYLCASGEKTVDKLHRDTIRMVKATSQAEFADKMLPLLTEEELAYYRRGKNSHVHAVPKSATPPSTPRPPAWRPCSATCSCRGRRNGPMRFLIECGVWRVESKVVLNSTLHSSRFTLRRILWHLMHSFYRP